MSLLRALLASAAVVGLLAGAELKMEPGSFLAHEWGTFTSVADEDGSAVEWATLLGPADLPCFVTRARDIRKWAAPGLVRMETPVLYFYAQQPATVSVHVDFPRGLITEWYPNPLATTQQRQPEWDAAKSIDWTKVQLVPGKDLSYPMTDGASRYYAARNTDATPLRIGEEQEKMIFYRGLGNFEPPLRAMYTNDGRLEIKNTGTQPIPFAIFFENQAGALGYRIAEPVGDTAMPVGDTAMPVGGTAMMEPPELNRDLAAIQQTLVTRLTGLGLYPKEARAMVDTWADSWFTEGARVLYIVPRATVDSVLPLTITPVPREIRRVFVGRMEVLSPATKRLITHAVRSGDNETLTALGRFLEPFVAQMQRTDKEFVLSPAVRGYLRAIATGRSVGDSEYGQILEAPGSNCIP
ncbi:MAG TPA: hypothetical protein VIY49_06685 [Bryobacteraceae bacterium]